MSSDKHQRRLFIQKCLSGSLGLAGVLGIAGHHARANEKTEMAVSVLIDALKASRSPVCERAAVELMGLRRDARRYNLHLRSAGLGVAEVKRVASAIKAVHDNGGPELRSFSMSYNRDLGDAGVLHLVEALPVTITELGLVDCGIGDKGGEALLAWAGVASRLRWLCVEQNAFSRQTAARLRGLGSTRSGLLVVV